MKLITTALKSLTCAALLSIGMSTAMASPSDMSGAYVGAGIGASRLNMDAGPRLDVNKSGTSLGIYGGYRFNDTFASEVGFSRLGDISLTPKGTETIITASTHMTSLSGLAYLPVMDNTEAFGRVGVAHFRTKVQGQKFNDTKLLVGLGAEYSLTKHLALRGEFQFSPNVLNSGNSVNSSLGFKAKF